MDLRLMDAAATVEERDAVDAFLGPADSGWDGGQRRAVDGHVAFGGFHEAQRRRHLLLPALHAVQDALGWVSQGALNYISERLLVPPAEAYGVASFYALLALEERPARVAHVCNDIVCRRRGGLDLLGSGRDDLIPSPCLGQCDRTPAAFVQRAAEADTVVVGASPEAIDAVLGGNDPDPAPVTVGSLGPARLLRRVGRREGSILDAYLADGGYRALRRAVDMGPEWVIGQVKASKIRGRGGAAFPMGVKWEAVAGADDPVRYVICNADESEPGTFKDRVLMEGDPFALVESLTIAGLAVGAARGYLYIRAEYPHAVARMRAAVDAARTAGLLGADVAGSGEVFDIEIRRGGGAYICGEETALMNSIEGHRGEPRNKPPFPTQHGLFGKPTVINNVETLMNVPQIVLEGGEAFAGIGTEQSTGPKLFCVSGDVGRPGTYEVPFGATLGDVIELAGGVAGTGHLRAVLLGGAAGVFVGPDMVDMPLTFEAAREAGVTLGSGVVMLFDSSTDFGDTVRRIAAFFRDESCGQCVPCRVGTVRQEELLIRHQHGLALDGGLLGEIAQVMADASICGLGHTAASAVRSAEHLGLI